VIVGKTEEIYGIQVVRRRANRLMMLLQLQVTSLRRRRVPIMTRNIWVSLKIYTTSQKLKMLKTKIKKAIRKKKRNNSQVVLLSKEKMERNKHSLVHL